MESTYTKLALYGSKNECARTDTVVLPISEVCDGTVSLWIACLGEPLSENAFSSTAIKICSLACTRFPETNMLSDQS